MQRIDWVFGIACLLAGPIDLLLSVPNWHLESNPVALWLGPWLLTIVKVVVISSGIYLWLRSDVSNHPVGQACAVSLCALYTFVCLSNAVVLLTL